jgi:hypothetical protein
MKRHGAIPEERWAEVQRRLDAVERDQHCRILRGGIGQPRLGLPRTREMGSGPRIPVLDRLIAAEIADAAGSASEMPGRPPSDLEAADRLFRRLIRR